MRTLERNICGEALTAATDEELVTRMREHVQTEHPSTRWDDDAGRETIARDAYEATDS